MKNWKKNIKSTLIGLLGLVCMANNANAEESNWPTGPITIITPWAVGGLADQINRAMSEYGKEHYGQPLLADNILGSGGAVAFTQYLKEKPNTHKLILGGEGSFAIAPLTMKVSYKYEDFVPIISIYSSTFILTSNPKTGVNNFEDFKNYVASGKKVRIAANGTAKSAASESLQTAALLTKMEANYQLIPYDGANEALTAVVSGEADFAVTHAALAKEFVKANNIKPIVAFDEKRLVDDVYDLDSVVQHGYDTWMTNMNAVFIRAGTSQAIIDKNYEILKKILETPKLQQTVKNMGMELDIRTGAEVDAYIKSTIQKVHNYYELLK
ncbi:tripartite tricarboxylate transporter substrate binding protein [[Pasteurella] aerogenes]